MVDFYIKAAEFDGAMFFMIWEDALHYLLYQHFHECSNVTVANIMALLLKAEEETELNLYLLK